MSSNDNHHQHEPQALQILLEVLSSDQRLKGLDPVDASARSVAIELCMADYLMGSGAKVQAPGFASMAQLVRAAWAQIEVPEPLDCSSLGSSDIGKTIADRSTADDVVVRSSAYEPLVSLEDFALALPHAYAQLGAPYEQASPFQLRAAVVERLKQAQIWLNEIRPGFQLEVFDAYRPVSVQAYMVQYTLQEALAAEAISWDMYQANLDLPLHQRLRQKVEQVWAEI